jgi:hypothetical protein
VWIGFVCLVSKKNGFVYYIINSKIASQNGGISFDFAQFNQLVGADWSSSKVCHFYFFLSGWTQFSLLEYQHMYEVSAVDMANFCCLLIFVC